MNIEDIKKLREATGAGMMDAKSALEEAKGDYEIKNQIGLNDRLSQNNCQPDSRAEHCGDAHLPGRNRKNHDQNKDVCAHIPICDQRWPLAHCSSDKADER